MNRLAGIWIDHSHAIIVSIFEGRETIDVIESNAEKHQKMLGGARSRSPYGAMSKVSEKQVEKKKSLWGKYQNASLPIECPRSRLPQRSGNFIRSS